VQVSDIRRDMDVIGADGVRLGVVDHLSGDRIALARHGSLDGVSHHVPLSAVARVDSAVHLNTTAAALGLAAMGAGASAASATATRAQSALPPIRNPAVEGARPRGNYYLPWVLLGVALLALLVLATRSCSNDREEERTRRPEPGTVATAPLAVESVKLPNGRSIDLQPGTLNYTLQRYLASDEPTPRAFVFDNLNFETASAAIRSGDAATVEALAQIMRAYPRASAQIVGYTDARGSAANNAALGELRAQAVAAALVERGVARQRLEARSGGEAAPKASNTTDDGQAENRRTELVITQK
jgi:outer membrane protein OmpA-like peptidoglycan-associated protein